MEYHTIEEFQTYGGDLCLPSDEYKGPIEIDHPCTVDGGKSTIWAERGPVFVVSSPGVTLRHLRIEVTGGYNEGAESTALSLRYNDTVLDDVEVRGTVEGVSREEDGRCGLPAALALGEFAADSENTFSVPIEVKTDTTIHSELKGVTFTPAVLTAGVHRLIITVSPMRHDTILYGEIIFSAQIRRRCCIMGKALQDAPVRQDYPQQTRRSVQDGKTYPQKPPQEMIAPPVSADAGQVDIAQRGQRAAVDTSQTLKIAFHFDALRVPVEIDPYIFLLHQQGKAVGDSDLIFFGNDKSPDGAVRILSGSDWNMILCDLDKVEEDIQRIALCYAIYNGDAQKNFSLVDSPMMRLFTGEKEWMRFPFHHLTGENTVVGAEFYRYGGSWKINFVGAGYAEGLKPLCRQYGIDVE